jgi:hypothetical protein
MLVNGAVEKFGPTKELFAKAQSQPASPEDQRRVAAGGAKPVVQLAAVDKSND